MREYIEKIHQKINRKELFRKLFPKQESGQSRDSYMRQSLMLSVKYGAFVLAALAIVRGGYTTVSRNVTTSSNVNGRELPIYCVETDEKKVALSFDAAWGNEDTSKILEILAKQNVKVTFFMTGGWVDKWAYLKCFCALFYHILQLGNPHFSESPDKHPAFFHTL